MITEELKHHDINVLNSKMIVEGGDKVVNHRVTLQRILIKVLIESKVNRTRRRKVCKSICGAGWVVVGHYGIGHIFNFPNCPWSAGSP